MKRREIKAPAPDSKFPITVSDLFSLIYNLIILVQGEFLMGFKKNFGRFRNTVKCSDFQLTCRIVSYDILLGNNFEHFGG